MAETKRCPYCGEEILAVAKKCKHCGEWLEEKKEEPKEQVTCEKCEEMIDEDTEKEQGGIFMHYFFDVIKNHYADFHRSVTRKEYWLFTLFYFLTSYALWCLAFINFTFAMVVVSIYGLGVLIPSLAMSVCRLRDIGKKWTNLFFILIPIVGSIILLVFFCTKGKKKNKGNAKMKTFDYVIIVLAIVGWIAYFWGAFSMAMVNAFDGYYYY